VTDFETKFSFDPECYRLAEHFLPVNAPESVKRELAQAIQDAVESYLVGIEE